MVMKTCKSHGISHFLLNVLENSLVNMQLLQTVLHCVFYRLGFPSTLSQSGLVQFGPGQAQFVVRGKNDIVIQQSPGLFLNEGFNEDFIFCYGNVVKGFGKIVGKIKVNENVLSGFHHHGNVHERFTVNVWLL